MEELVWKNKAVVVISNAQDIKNATVWRGWATVHVMLVFGYHPIANVLWTLPQLPFSLFSGNLLLTWIFCDYRDSNNVDARLSVWFVMVRINFLKLWWFVKFCKVHYPRITHISIAWCYLKTFDLLLLHPEGTVSGQSFALHHRLVMVRLLWRKFS